MDAWAAASASRKAKPTAKIVREYPLSAYADDAASKLKELEMPVPEADKAAVARMQYEKDHREKPGLIQRDTLFYAAVRI